MTEPCVHGAADPADPRNRWEQRYVQGDTPWDLGGAPPALARAVAGFPASRRLVVLVPGAGFGHDALAWAAAGHAVTAVDVAPTPARALEARARRAGLPVRVLEADVLALPPGMRGTFDLVWEQTCLCALPPECHVDYVRAMAEALRPGGVFLGLFWNHGRPGGPPYDLSPAAVRALFGAAFEERSLEPVPDPPPGRAPEFLYRASMRAR